MPTVYDGRGQKHRGSATNFSAIIATVIQLMASSSQILFYLMLFVQISLQKWLGDKERVSISYIIVYAALHHCTGLLSRNLKPRKLILRAFSDFPRKLAPPKITRHTVGGGC
jgi:hypothetical protein